jgi:hypothetical protein
LDIEKLSLTLVQGRTNFGEGILFWKDVNLFQFFYYFYSYPEFLFYGCFMAQY